MMEQKEKGLILRKKLSTQKMGRINFKCYKKMRNADQLLRKQFEQLIFQLQQRGQFKIMPYNSFLYVRTEI